jgi:hypothetical protein
MSFRLKGKRVLFTWSQVPDSLDHVQVFEHLDHYEPVERAIIAREPHADGGYHFHAYVEWTRHVDRQVRTQLDIRDIHPNIAPKRTPAEIRNAQEYVRKDDDWIEYGEWEGQEDTDPPGIIELARGYAGWGEFMDQCLRMRIPFQYAKEAWSITKANPPKTFLEGETTGEMLSLRGNRD